MTVLADEVTWQPVAVALVDLDSPGPAPVRPYRQAWLVGLRTGVPVGIAEVDLRKEGAWEQAIEVLAGSGTEEALARVPDDCLPGISVVVPTVVQRVDDLRLCLSSLVEQDHPDAEVILVDNRPLLPAHDPLPQLLEAFPTVRLVAERQPGISAARNRGLREATGDVVVFTDDDVRVQPDWLRAIGTRFVREPGATAVTGLILPAELETPSQLHFERFYGGFSGVRTFSPLTLRPGRRRGQVEVVDSEGAVQREFAVYGIGAFGAGANMAFRRSWLCDGHGFDLALGVGTAARGGEDLAALVDVLWSGGSIAYEPAAVVWHRHRREREELQRQLSGNGVGFVAMLSSLVLRDRRHLLSISGQLPKAAGSVVRQALHRLRSSTRRPPDASDASGDEASARAFPRALILYELAGMPRGPWAYARSRRAARRRDSAKPSTDEERS